MTGSIFAGPRSLDELLAYPESPASPDESPATALRSGVWDKPLQDIQQAIRQIEDSSALATCQYQPLPEPVLSNAAKRVREQARSLGIDYDSEIARVINQLKGQGLAVASPWNRESGPDPLAALSSWERRQVETAAVEILRREHSL